MNKTEIITEKSYVTWIKFVMAWILFLGFNFLILYFYPRNIYIDISFVLVVFFTFKFLKLNSINIFLYGVSYLWWAFIIIFFRNFSLSQRLIDSITFYIPCFFILSSLGFIYEEKIEKRITFRKKKISYLCLFCVFSVLFIFLFISFNLEQPSIKIIINNTKTIINNTKEVTNRTFNKEEYYSKKEFEVIDGEKVKEKIIISAYSSQQGIPFPGKIKIKGWALEKNSKYDTGINRIEFFLDGKPGDGKYLGKFSQNYDTELETKKFIKNLYFNFYDRSPSKDELSFWAMNLEWNNMSYYDVANSIINSSKIFERKLQKEECIRILYKGALNREADGEGLKHWVKTLSNGDANYNDVLYSFLNSSEFKALSENYYKKVKIKEPDLDLVRRDVGDKHGKQFYLSGFSFVFNSTKFKNGEHNLYVYAHSPIFGWDYVKINLIINNNF